MSIATVAATPARIDADDPFAVPALSVEDDAVTGSMAAVPRNPAVQAAADDEIVTLALDDAQWSATAWPLSRVGPPWRIAAVWPEDEPQAPIVLPPMIDEDGFVMQPRQVPSWIVSFACDDDAPFIGIIPVWETIRVTVTARPAQPIVRARRR